MPRVCAFGEVRSSSTRVQGVERSTCPEAYSMWYGMPGMPGMPYMDPHAAERHMQDLSGRAQRSRPDLTCGTPRGVRAPAPGEAKRRPGLRARAAAGCHCHCRLFLPVHQGWNWSFSDRKPRSRKGLPSRSGFLSAYSVGVLRKEAERKRKEEIRKKQEEVRKKKEAYPGRRPCNPKTGFLLRNLPKLP